MPESEYEPYPEGEMIELGETSERIWSVLLTINWCLIVGVNLVLCRALVFELKLNSRGRLFHFAVVIAGFYIAAFVLPAEILGEMIIHNDQFGHFLCRFCTFFAQWAIAGDTVSEIGQCLDQLAAVYKINWANVSLKKAKMTLIICWIIAGLYSSQVLIDYAHVISGKKGAESLQCGPFIGSPASKISCLADALVLYGIPLCIMLIVLVLIWRRLIASNPKSSQKIQSEVKLLAYLAFAFALLNAPIVVVTIYDRFVQGSKGIIFQHIIRGAKLLAYCYNWICGVISLIFDHELKVAAFTGKCCGTGNSGNRIIPSNEVLYGISNRKAT